MRNFIMWDSIQRFKFTLHLKHANFINLSYYLNISQYIIFFTIEILVLLFLLKFYRIFLSNKKKVLYSKNRTKKEKLINYDTVKFTAIFFLL